MTRPPFEGASDPKLLAHGLAGHRSRRIDDGHHILCRFEGAAAVFGPARHHH